MKKLFHICKDIIGASKKCILPDHDNELTLADTFNSFFIDKSVENRDEIFQCATPDATKLTAKHFFDTDAETITNFELTTEEKIRSILILILIDFYSV